MSGSTPQCSTANQRPVRPQPVITSSTMRSTPRLLGQARQVLGRRHEDAVGANNGLDEDRGHVLVMVDHVGKIVGAGRGALGVGPSERAAVAVDLGSEDDARNLARWLDEPAAEV